MVLMCGSTVALLVAMSAIGCAMGGPNETHWEDAPNIGGDGLTAMLHAVRKRQAETKPETTPMTEPDGGGTEVKKEFMDYVQGVMVPPEQDEKKLALVTEEGEGIVTFHANVTGPTETIRLRFSEEGTCSRKGKNDFYAILNVCKAEGTEGKCAKGTASCFPGRLDPNNKPGRDYSYALPNENKELAKICNAKEAREKWPEWANITEMHTLQFSSADGKTLNIQVSFMMKDTGSVVYKDGRDSEQIEFGPDGCVQLWLGTAEDAVVGKITNQGSAQEFEKEGEKGEDGNENKDDKKDGKKNKGTTIQQTDFWLLRSNGVPQRKMPLASSLPADMFVGTNGSKVPILAFIGAEQCQLTIKISGPHLKRCMDRECTSEVQPVGPEYLYSDHKAALKPVFKNEDVPVAYFGSIFFDLNKAGKEEGTLIVQSLLMRLHSQGRDLFFSVATKTPEPPVLFLRYPLDQGRKCLEKDNPTHNEIVLAYNGRPDCFVSFGWSERMLRLRDSAGITRTAVGGAGFPVHIKGEGANEFLVQMEDGQMKKLGSGPAHCPIQSRELRKPFEEIAGHKYIWDFIINPTIGHLAWRTRKPQCMIALSVDLTEYRLLLTDF